MRPSSVPARERVDLRFRATASDRPVAGAVVRVGDDWALTSASGVAQLRVRAPRGGRIKATASRADLHTGKASVTVR